jgi:phosphatidate cytidylyltransferase
MDAKGQGLSSLTKRVLTALVLIPVSLLIFFWGYPAFHIFLVFIFGACALEWMCMITSEKKERWGINFVAILALLLIVCLAQLKDYFTSLTFLLIFFLLYLGGIFFSSLKKNIFFLSLGFLIIPLSCLSLLYIYDQGPQGKFLVLFLAVLIWTTDTFAFFVGKKMGGPKLAAKISPNKTWSGSIGGILGSLGVGLIFKTTGLLNFSLPLMIFLSFSLSAVAQVSDLMESWLKRSFGVKDSGHWIPGHGGILDRMDSFLLAAPALGLFLYLFF